MAACSLPVRRIDTDYPTDTNNFQPRVGAEYQLNPNVVLRGGFGIIYFNTLESPLGQGFSSSTGYVATAGQYSSCKLSDESISDRNKPSDRKFAWIGDAEWSSHHFP